MGCTPDWKNHVIFRRFDAEGDAEFRAFPCRRTGSEVIAASFWPKELFLYQTNIRQKAKNRPAATYQACLLAPHTVLRFVQAKPETRLYGIDACVAKTGFNHTAGAAAQVPAAQRPFARRRRKHSLTLPQQQQKLRGPAPSRTVPLSKILCPIFSEAHGFANCAPPATNQICEYHR